jgi:hypothetical protein
LVVALFLAACGQAVAQPLITLQPLNILNLILGDNATFQVAATSTATTNLQYQWLKNGVRIPGATNSTFTVNSTLATDCGAFTVRVNDGVGVVESTSAELTVNILSLLGTTLLDALSLTNGQIRSTNIDAVKEPGEPDIIPGDPGGSAVWYTWTPLIGGIATFTTTGSDFDTLLGVYTGSEPGNLVTVPSAINNDDGGGYLSSKITFNASALTTYLITVDGYYGAQGNIVLTWGVTPGDTLPSATGTPAAVTSSLATGVQLSSPWPGEVCDWLFNGVVVATKTNAMTVTNVSDATVGSYVGRYTTANGSVAYARPTSLQENTLQDGSTATNSIAWNKFLDSANCAFIPPTQSKQKLEGGGDSRGYSVAQVFSTQGYDDEPGEPIICNQDGGSPAWYTFVTPVSGSLVISAAGSSFNTVLGVFIGPGNNFSTLTNIGCGYTTNYSLDGQPVVSIANVPANQTNYIVVEGEDGASGTVHLNISLGDPVSIDAPPTNQSAGPGTNVTLAVSASGAAPLSYFWQFNGINIPGATTGTLTISNMQDSQAGSYTVVVSNLVSVTAAQAVVSLVLAPSIVNQPSNQVVCVSASATLSCAATGGAPLAYQWQYGGTNCASATNSSLTVTNAQTCDAGSYSCLVTNLAGAATSSVAILTVTQALPLVTWTNPVPIAYGAALSSIQLNATANVPGGFAYNPTNGTVLNAGTNTLSVIFTPTDMVDYSSSTNVVGVVVSQAPLLVTAANASRLYGAANPVFTGTITGLTNGDNITPAYSSSATTSSPTGTYAIVPNLVDPNNRQTNFTVSLISGTLTVGQATPIMTWTNPAPIIYGAALSSNQLNATANVPGGFAYNPTNGTVLNAGTNTLSVIFTPTDTVDYSSSTNVVSVVVSQALMIVTAANASRLYGAANPVFTGTITGLTNGDNVTAANSCSATTSSPAGTYAIVPSLVDPNNRQANYTVNLVSGTLTVGQTTPIMTWTNPAPIIYGAALSSNQLNATANVPGGFAYNPTNGTALNAGTNTLSVIFTPTDTVDYSAAIYMVSLVVAPAPLSLTANNAIRPYGAANPAFTGTMIGLTNGDDITAIYTCTATTNSPVGTYAITPTLVDPNISPTNYTVTLVNGTLTITQAVPLVTWTDPAPITHGAPLSSNQLNATANVPGNFAYDPTNGTVLDAGTNTLSVIFTPTDTVDYSSATYTVSLVIHCVPKYLLHIDTSNLSSAGAQLTMSAVPGQIYELQASTNLVDWVSVNTVTADAAGTIQVLDAGAKDCPQRFYRAMTQ